MAMCGFVLLLLFTLNCSFTLLYSSAIKTNFSASSLSMWTPTESFILHEELFSYTWINNRLIQETTAFDEYLYRKILERLVHNVSFSCGFFCDPPCDSYYFVVTIGYNTDLNKKSRFAGFVWTANRDSPVRENATLQITQDGLLLRDSDSSTVWSTNNSNSSSIIPISGMNITEEGNLVLFDNNNELVWQSFDHPTNTLVNGQKLKKGERIVSGSHDTNQSSASFYVSVTSNGFSAFVAAHPPQMYFQLKLNGYGRNNSRSNYLLYERGRLVLGAGNSNRTYQISAGNSDVQYMRLGSRGHLKIYELRESNNWQEVSDLVSVELDECQHPLECGSYGVCKDDQCSCPKTTDGVQYFKQINTQLPDQGCAHITRLSCQNATNHRLVDFGGNLSYFNLIDSNAAVPGLRDLAGCKAACLKNCSCKAAFFKYYGNISDGYCYLPSQVFSLRADHIPGNSYKSSAFIKVQIPSMAPSPEAINGSRPEVSSPTLSRKKHNAPMIAGFSGAAVVISIIVSVLCIVVLRKKKDVNEEWEYQIEQLTRLPMRFTYEDLRVATNNFNEKLGGGGFGSVFRGVLRDGTRIAVKRLDNIGQGMKEFLAEVETIGSIHHVNLVKLIGFCAEKSYRLLIYGYMSNGSLDNWIFYKNQKPPLDWQTRKKIILGIAKGLAYLHEDCQQKIVHLDIKPQNILLDENFNAKVSDFGLSRLIDKDQSQVLTSVRGTPGYMAPEWQRSGIPVKADIYSFGIVVLEIVSGRKNYDKTQPESCVHLLSLLQKKAGENQLIEIVDKHNEDMQCHGEEALKMIKIAAWCLQDDHTRRPLMSVAVKVLEGLVELEDNISFKFSNAMPPHVQVKVNVPSEPQPYILSAPR